jgi:hypothetical protein
MWPSWPWSYGSLIYYLCNQCLSQLMRVWILIRARCTTLCDKVCQSLATGRSFPTPINLTATISLKYCCSISPEKNRTHANNLWSLDWLILWEYLVRDWMRYMKDMRCSGLWNNVVFLDLELVYCQQNPVTSNSFLTQPSPTYAVFIVHNLFHRYHDTTTNIILL